MKTYTLSAFILIVCLFALVNLNGAQGQSISYIQSTNFTLYRDGIAHCTQELVLDTSIPEITIPLLSESPQNILLLDENSIAVDYKVVGNNLTAYVLGAKILSVEYDTTMLTSKQAEIWTLKFQTPYNLTTFLPTNSTIIYLSEVPLAIETKQNTIALSLASGSWEISYILPTSPSELPSNTPKTEPLKSDFKIEYIIAIIIVVAIVAFVGFFFVFKKRKPSVSLILKANPSLSKDDQEVIQFLIEKDGKAFEAELREKFPNMPRTSLWRLVRRLERLEVVEVRKIGLENQVQLKK